MRNWLKAFGISIAIIASLVGWGWGITCGPAWLFAVLIVVPLIVLSTVLIKSDLDWSNG